MIFFFLSKIFSLKSFVNCFFFTFTELPVKILKPLEDVKCAEKETITFECEISRANAVVKWLRVCK